MITEETGFSVSIKIDVQHLRSSIEKFIYFHKKTQAKREEILYKREMVIETNDKYK